MKHSELLPLVHEANRSAHDYYSERHDKVVPYIARPKTRSYYWNLIKDVSEKHEKSFKNQMVLELGCGTGTFTDLALSEGIKGLHGIDLSPKMIDRAKQKCPHPSVEYFVAPLEEFAKTRIGQYDVVYSSSFLHHLADLEVGLTLISNMLKPNGIYIAIHEPITTIKKKSKVEKLDDALQYLSGYWHEEVPLLKRISNVFARGANFLLKRIFSKSKNNDISQNSTNLIDYQLNQPFSLSTKCQNLPGCKTIPYCYMAFTELMLFGKPTNYELLVLKK